MRKAAKLRIYILETQLEYNRSLGDTLIVKTVMDAGLAVPTKWRGNSKYRNQTHNEHADNIQIELMLAKGELTI